MNLNDSFHAFLRSLDDSEEIDCFADTSEHPGLQKADFLLAGRSAVCEIKRIMQPPDDRLNDFVHELNNRDDWPIVYGAPRSFERVVRDLPDKDQLRRRFNERYSRSIETSIKDANRQIRDTKVIFQIPDSKGILILLNEEVHALTPNVTAGRIISCLKKLSSDHITPRFEHVSQVLVVDKSHLQYDGENIFSFPMFAVENPLAPDENTRAVVDSMMQEWPTFDGFGAVQVDWGKFDQEFFAASEIKSEK